MRALGLDIIGLEPESGSNGGMAIATLNVSDSLFQKNYNDSANARH
jgi:hypothetical protein